MSEIIAYLFGYGTLVFIFITALLLPIVGIGLAMTRPALLTLAYIAILFGFSQSTYGELVMDRTIYSRGTGQLFFSFLTWALVGMSVMAAALNKWTDKKPIPTHLGIPFLLLTLLFIGHLAVAPIQAVKIEDALSGNGFINLLLLGLFIYVMTRTLNDRVKLQWLEKLILIMGAVRAGYGLVRWAAFGGDKANVYENYEHLSVKLTYFDICDSMIAGVVLFYCLRRLFSDWKQMSGFQRMLFIVLAAMEFALIVLSYRRTAWGGLALILAFFALLLPLRQRIAAMVAAPLVALPVVAVSASRLNQIKPGASFFHQFFYDLIGRHGLGHSAESARTLELHQAFKTFLDNPIFGVGAWGRYEEASGIGWQVGPEAFKFVHSGLLHIMFKTGLAGTSIVLFALFVFIRFVIKARRDLPERDRWLFDASLAGLIFMSPDFLLGTPIVQFRTMLLYGVLMAIPFLITGVARREQQVSA